jgi:GDP/UDP-N,N'-diacetylbacillosamine 2-epimerase (hydrolysing)
MDRKICVVTGSRAEYGLLRWVIEGIQKSPLLKLQLVATGSHLSPEFGMTSQEIEEDGYHIDRRVEMLLSSDSPVGIGKSMGLGLISFSDVLSDLKPDLMLVLGDRFEIFSVVSAAMATNIPIAHIHGGETTEGAMDEAIRHAITKMSHLHFVAAPEYKRRVEQMGEDPDRVFVVGGLGVDNIISQRLMPREELESSLNMKFAEKNLLITFHPVTLDIGAAQQQVTELLAALGPLKDTRLIFTLPNADTEGRTISSMILDFVSKNPNAKAFPSLGYRRYLSAVRFVDGVVGNSSSGLLEVPSFKKGTVNIGDRQKGRLCAESVINCAPERTEIQRAIDRLYDESFRQRLKAVKNPYGEGGAAEKVVSILERANLDNVLRKRFFDYKS